MNNEWKYTIPISRAITRDDGLYIIGEATGPEPDTHGSQMDPAAILDFHSQIISRASSGNPLPYKDAHGRGGGVLQDLGWVMAASITPNFHLQIEVKLDDTNPAAQWLHSAIERGKQYGMSVKGNVQDFVYAKTDAGNRVMRFMKIALEEISNTTQPSWVPSFGTVLARSIDGESGETDMNEENPTATADVVESDAQSTDVAVEPSEVALSADQTEGSTVDTTTEVVVERALSKADRDALAAAFSTLREQMTSLGIVVAEASAPETTPDTTPDAAPVAAAPEDVSRESDTSETGDTSESASELVEFHGMTISREASDALTTYIGEEIARAVEPLNLAIAQKDTYIAELLALPAGKVPGVVARDKFADNADAFTAQLERMESPEARLRFALEHVYSGS